TDRVRLAQPPPPPRPGAITAGICAGTRTVKLPSVTNDLYDPPLPAGTARDCHRPAAAAAHHTRGCDEVLRWVLMPRLSGRTARRQAKTRSQPDARRGPEPVWVGQRPRRYLRLA